MGNIIVIALVKCNPAIYDTKISSFPEPTMSDDTAKQVTANGGQVLNGPRDVPGGERIAQCKDPQGTVFAVHSNT
jgi:predicted enzyme related to lactoylglutathione lyase